MIDSSIMVLQNCKDFLKGEPDSSSETCITTHDGNQVIDVKVEEVSDTQEVEDPLLTTLPEIKSEREVSFVYVCPNETCAIYGMDFEEFFRTCVEVCILLHISYAVPVPFYIDSLLRYVKLSTE
jgi:hypothetical protein